MGWDPRLRYKVIQTITIFSKYMPKDCVYIITRLYGHVMVKTFASDGLLCVYKTYKLIKLYWHVRLYNSIIIHVVIQTNMSVVLSTYLLLYK